MTRRKRTKEATMLRPVAAYMARKGFRLQSEELCFYEHRIDLYAVSPSKSLTVAIELKLTDWRRAFEQALLYQLCADFVYIAVPLATLRRVDVERLAEYGIGLITVTDGDRCREDLRPRRSDVMRRSYRTTYIRIVREANHGRR